MDAIENVQAVTGLCTHPALRYHMLDSLTVWRPISPDNFAGRLAASRSRAVICATSHDLTHLSILLQSIFILMIGINIPLACIGKTIHEAIHISNELRRS